MNINEFLRKDGDIRVRLTKLKYKRVKECKSVVVVGGGPSTSTDQELINSYISSNNSIVIGTNYSYPFLCNMDYTYFGDINRFKANISSIRGGLFACVSIVDRFKREFWSSLQTRCECYEVFLRGLRHGNSMPNWGINPNGTFPSGKYAPSGLAVCCISLLFRPEEVVLTGMDGPIISNSRLLKKKTFDGRTKVYGPIKKYNLRKEALEFKVIKLLQENSVKVKCVPSSPLWGISKKKYGIINI